MRIKRLLSQLTLEEKLHLLIGSSLWETVPLKQHGIHAIRMTDGPHGLRNEVDLAIKNELQIPESKKATCFPTASALGSSWDTGLIKLVGKALGEECRQQGVDLLLGPGNNIKRLPICGRNFEYFSEDPYLAGQLAAAYINGIQSKGVGAVLKHFVANNQEYERHRISAELTDRALREIYLEAFKKPIIEAKPWGIMAAYNRLNSTYCTESPWLLNHVLRNEWGYQGVVISDWGAVQNRVKALKAGTDLEMPGPREESYEILLNAVKRGDLDESTVDISVERILKLVERIHSKNHYHFGDLTDHHKLAQKAARESMVLLKNEDKILPLKGNKVIAVVGLASKEPRIQGGGSSEVNPKKVDIPFEALESLAGSAVLLYEPGYTMEDEESQTLIDDALKITERADVVVIFVCLPPYKESEFYDREDLTLPNQQINLIQSIARNHSKVVVVLNNGSPVTMGGWHEKVQGIMEAWLYGEGGGQAIAELLFGVMSPSGRLAESFPIRLEDTPSFIHYPGENHKAYYGEGIFVGYRYYDYRKMKTLYPFGYGLSYTVFEYNNLKLSKTKMKDSDFLEVVVTITNTGPYPSYEVVQVYVNDSECSIPRPVKELKAFEKVWLESGQTKKIYFTLDKEAFSYYDPKYSKWIVETGDFNIHICSSTEDIRVSKGVHVIATDELPSRLHVGSTLREWLEDRKGRKVIKRLMKTFRINPKTIKKDTRMNIDAWRAAQDIPLKSLLEHIRIKLPMRSDRMIHYLLNHVKGRPKKNK